jgi:hypothetical protein
MITKNWHIVEGDNPAMGMIAAYGHLFDDEEAVEEYEEAHGIYEEEE